MGSLQVGVRREIGLLEDEGEAAVPPVLGQASQLCVADGHLACFA